MHDNSVTLRVGTLLRTYLVHGQSVPDLVPAPREPPHGQATPLSGGHRVVRTAPEIVSMMRALAPPGQPGLDQATMDRLSELTRALRAAVPSAAAEYARFQAIGGRSLPLPGAALDAWLGGKSVLVTGGTGCIG